MYYHRTNRNQLGTVNAAVPSNLYTPITINVPNGPHGATTATLYNLSSASLLSAQSTVVDNHSYLDTVYNGVDITANKRMSHHWQMVAGLTFGKNTGGLNSTSGQSGTADLNDPNTTLYTNGIVGNDSPVAFRLSGSYQAPYGINVAGTLTANSGYPYVSTFQVTRANLASVCGCSASLVRSSQNVFLSARGDERLPAVKLVDLSVSRTFAFLNNRRIVPRLDIFNLFNSYTPTAYNAAVGPTYLQPSGGGIISPRIMRIGFSVNF
jgi:hypothetical protein